ATAAAVRVWSRRGRILAVGLLDGPDLLRLTLAPSVHRDAELGRRLVADVTQPDRGVLPAGRVSVEAPRTALLHDLLAEAGWDLGDPWTPLRRDLREPVPEPEVRIEPVGPERAAQWSSVVRGSFPASTFSPARWLALAGGVPFADARCLLACSPAGDAVAAVAVWSAGPGRPGLLEPMGVHREHRGRGYGRAVTLAAASALRELGSSSAVVCTPSANTGGVATYRSAGFEARPEVRDRVRP
ncbi:MAG TPA: GNAT family N-acetyltransferase, partial [Jatrophihabitans sp.]|nr:GNAT family N-acetyltransferase [Jatrophihabitans sp.]